MGATDPVTPSSPSMTAEAAVEARRLRDQDPRHQGLRKATRELEGWFVGTLLKKMHENAAKGGLFEQNAQSGMYRDMFDDAVANAVASSGSFGLADALYRELAPHLDEERR